MTDWADEKAEELACDLIEQWVGSDHTSFTATEIASVLRAVREETNEKWLEAVYRAYQAASVVFDACTPKPIQSVVVAISKEARIAAFAECAEIARSKCATLNSCKCCPACWVADLIEERAREKP